MSDQVIKWALSSMHKSGFDEIEIFYANSAQVRLVEDFVKDIMTGFAVLERSDKRLIVKSISKDTDEEFENALRRSFLLGLEIADASLKGIRFGQITFDFASLERQNNQLTNFCERILNKKGHSDGKKTNFYYVIIWNMEKIVDCYRDICKIYPGKRLNPETLSLYERVNSYFRYFYELMYKFDFEKLVEVSGRIRNEKHFNVKDTTEQVLVSKLFEITARCADFSASLVAINTLK
jgi:hypothetical protein